MDLDRTRRRAFADHDVDLEIFQRRVEDFLHHRAETVDFVDEQHIVGLEVGEQRGQIAGALEHRAGSLAQIDAHLGRHDVGQGGFAEARRAEQQHVVERFAALPGRLDENAQLVADFLLADVIGKALGAQRPLQRLFLVARALGRNQAGGGVGLAAPDGIGFDHYWLSTTSLFRFWT